ncbi:16914_t:CDS:2 [Rhizophagus irregularis]|nr:16914_t:CDS:2 [Rhizophagus irregularis]
MQRYINNPGFSQLRSLAFNNTPKNTNRCKTDIVQNLPTEILIQIFGNIISTNFMRICDDDEFFIREMERILIRLTCKRWNHIVISLISHAHYDIRKIKKHKLEYVVPPPTLKSLNIIDSRYLLSNLFDQLVDLSIVNCPQITEKSLSLMLKKLKNLESLTINTDKFFSSKLHEIIEAFSPKLCNLKLVIPFLLKLKQKINFQLMDLCCLPKSVNSFIICLQIPTYDNQIFTSTPPPNTLKRLDVSNCFFLKNLFNIPKFLTHLTVSYPSLPRDTIKLPSTIEYLNISGYIRNTLHSSSNCSYNYSKNWINTFPDNAPFLHTLILHMYASPQLLFPAIVRFADTIRYLDCRILLLNMIDISICEAPCYLGRQHQLDMIQELKGLVELRFHCRLEEKEIEKFPTTLKKLWLINGFNSQSIIDYAYRKGIKIFELPLPRKITIFN